jgi:hypothetical protein
MGDPRHALIFAGLLFALPAFGAGDPDEHLIRRSDVPADAPQFADYPAKPYFGPNAAPDLRSEPRSRQYRTVLKSWAGEKPNFAGHYILATWNCGASCVEIAIIDAITGKVFHPAGARSNFVFGVDEDLLEEVSMNPRRNDFGSLHYRADSRLLMLVGNPNRSAKDRGISWFVWEGNDLKRIRIVRKVSRTQ